MAYKRILLKLSGEQLSGKHEAGIDAEVASFIAKEVKKVTDAGVQVAIVIGAGNLVRGAQISGHGIKRVTGDHMGMLATLINALALTDIFEENGIATRCLSNIFADQVAEKFVHRLAHKHFENGRVVIVAGGAGRPYMTTDTAAVVLALEMDCDIVLKATKFDGVYDKDPAKYNDAVKLDSVSFDKALSDDAIKVMDKSAIGLAMEHDMNITIFDAFKPDNTLKVASGKHIGTSIVN